MTPFAWARELVKEGRIQMGNSKQLASQMEREANDPCPHCKTPAMMSLAWSRQYFFKQLAKDAMRGLKEPGTKVREFESVRRHEKGPKYIQRKMFTLPYFEDRLRHCREQIVYYTEKGRGLLSDAIKRGHKQLRLKFPEFK